MASVSIDVPTLTQCENSTIAWSSSGVEDKWIQVFVRGNDYFSERVTGPDLSGSLGSFSWTCDFPAGSYLGIEIHNTNGSIWSVGDYQQVQPGSTDACLRQNPGQLAPQRMAALASSLSSASPQLFTYAATATSTSSSASSTITSSPTSEPSSSGTTHVQPQPANSSSSSPNIGLIVGCTVGGVAVLAALALVAFFCLRRGRPGSSTNISASEKGPSIAPTGAAPSAAASGGGLFGTFTGGARRRSGSLSNPIQAWRGLIAAGRPPSGQGYEAASPVDLDQPRYAPKPMSSGPRAGVGEVYDAGVGYAAPSSRGAPSSSGRAYDSLPSPSEFVLPSQSNRYPPQMSSVAEVMDEGPFASLPNRPPTRLTTPGGASSWGGDGVSVVEQPRNVPYQSYTR